MSGERIAAGRIPELDGLRGLAIGLVLVYHLFLIPVAAEPGTFWAYVTVPGRLAWSGVDLFFVLSGFLIGGILLDEKNSPNYFRAFYARRFFRIVPMYTLTLVCFYAIVFLARWGHAKNLGWLLENQLPWYSYPLFLQNIWMVLRDTFGPLTLGVTWSLAVEEQFYLTLPPLVRFLDRRKLIYAVAAGILLAPVWRTAFHFLGPAYRQGIGVLMPCRADSLLLGVAGALLMRSPDFVARIRNRQKELLVLIGVLCLGFIWLTLHAPNSTQLPMFSFGYTLIAALYLSILLYGVNFPQSFIGRFLKIRWLRYLGLIAYGVYLMHPILECLVFGIARGKPVYIDSFGTLGLYVLVLAITILVCTASWKFFEKPLVKVGHRVSYSDRQQDSVSASVAEMAGGAGS